MNESRLRKGLRYALAGLLGGMAVLHVVEPEPFEKMIPGWLPGDPTAWNLGATAAEGTSALLLASRRTATAGGYLAAATFLGVWIGNIEQARLGHGVAPGADGVLGSNAAAWARLPLQLPMIWAAWRVARETEPPEAAVDQR